MSAGITVDCTCPASLALTIGGPASPADEDAPPGVEEAPALGEPVPLLPPVAAALVELEEALHPKMSKIPKNALTSSRLSNKGEGLSVTALPLESLGF